jgi:formylglycine-generating enzyme required for sulfatase activity
MLALAGAGLGLWLFLRPASSVDAAKPAPAPAANVQPDAPTPAAATQAPAAITAEQVRELKTGFEKLATLATSLDLNPQERAAFASTTMAAAQAQTRLASDDLEGAEIRWRDASRNLGQILAPKLASAYDAEAVALRGLNIAEYSGPALTALGDALAAADAAAANGEWAKAALHRQAARDSVGPARSEIAQQLGEAAANAAARGDVDLASYFYERTLRLDPSQGQAQAHLYLHKFKAGELTRASIGLELAYIPPGTFTRGSPPREPGRSNDETPRTVKLTRGFFIGVKEITQRDWDAVFGSGAAARSLLASRTLAEAKSPEGWIGADLPMHSVRWEDAVEFCRRLSAVEKRTFRLPTEAEWEYACRAGTASAFNTGGDGISSRDANIDDGSADAKYALAAASEPGRANRYGLRNMHGNVWEWCSDWSAPYPPGAAPLLDPAGPSDADAGRQDVAMKVIRGGGWNASASDARSANRAESSPAVGLGYIGFRVVQEPVLVGP